MTRTAPWTLLALIATPRAAMAQPTRAEVAWRAQVASAVSAQTAGDHARAVALAEEALAAHETPSLLRFVATERTALGRYPAALAAAQRCVAGATADVRVPERAATIGACAALVTDLEARVARLSLRLRTARDGAVVRVGDVTLPPLRPGASQVVDAGEITVTATAPDCAPFRRVVTARPGVVTEVEIALDPLPPPPLAVLLPRAAAPPPPPSASLPRGLATGAAITAGAAFVAGSVAVGLGASAAARFNENPRCTRQDGVVYGGASCVDDANAADVTGPLAVGAFVSAGVLGVASAVLFATAPRALQRTGFMCAPSLAGWSCVGRF